MFTVLVTNLTTSTVMVSPLQVMPAIAIQLALTSSRAFPKSICLEWN